MIQLALSRTGVVNTSGCPPAAATRNKPEAGSLVANKMVSSVLQLAPREVPMVRLTVTGGPPVLRTFLSTPTPSKKPIHWPSGEKKGPFAEPRPDSDVTPS